MNTPLNSLRRAYELLVAGANLLQSPLLLVLRLYFFWQLFLTGQAKLTHLGNTPTEKQPRGFSIDPAGRFVVVSGEKSDTISFYSIDPESGGLKLIGRYPTGKGSNWVEIVSFE